LLGLSLLLLFTGWTIRGSNACRGKGLFSTASWRLWSQPRLLCNGYGG